MQAKIFFRNNSQKKEEKEDNLKKQIVCGLKSSKPIMDVEVFSVDRISTCYSDLRMGAGRCQTQFHR